MLDTSQYSHLTLTGYYAGSTLCGNPKNPDKQHYHAAYAPKFVFTDEHTCPICLQIWNAPDEDEQ